MYSTITRVQIVIILRFKLNNAFNLTMAGNGFYSVLNVKNNKNKFLIITIFLSLRSHPIYARVFITNIFT